MASGPVHAGGRGLIAAADAFAVIFQHHIGTRGRRHRRSFRTAPEEHGPITEAVHRQDGTVKRDIGCDLERAELADVRAMALPRVNLFY
jgi:hypothetical protein